MVCLGFWPNNGDAAATNIVLSAAGNVPADNTLAGDVTGNVGIGGSGAGSLKLFQCRLFSITI